MFHMTDSDYIPQVAVLGSASGIIGENERKKARIIGATIAKAGCTLIFGACPGLPYEAAKDAKKAGGRVIGFSPASNFKEHVEKYGFPTDAMDSVVFTGFERNGRNTVLVRSADAVIIIGGGFGTLNEFSAAIQEKKPIGVLANSGGITRGLKKIVALSSRPARTEINYLSEPIKLAKKMAAIAKRNANSQNR